MNSTPHYPDPVIALADLVSAAKRDDDAYFAEGEKRRRLSVELEMVRMAAAEMMCRLSEGAGCRLPYEQQMTFDRLSDPYLAANRMSEAYARVVMLEQRIGEDAETKTKRRADEEAEREAKARAAEQRKRDSVDEDKESRVKRAAGLAYRTAFPSLPRFDREDLLKDIIDEFEEFSDFTGDPAEALSSLCRTIANKPEAQLAAIPQFQDRIGEPADDGERFIARCGDWAQACLAWIDRMDQGQAGPDIPPPRWSEHEPAHGPPRAA